MFGVKAWLSTLRAVYPLGIGESRLCLSRLNLRHKTNTEDEKHPGSDHHQYQRRKVGFV